MPTTTTCFSCPDPVPPGLRRMPTSTSCFRYQAEAPPRRPLSCYSYPMMCFSYPDDVPGGGESVGATPPSPPGLRRMPGTSTCFRY